MDSQLATIILFILAIASVRLYCDVKEIMAIRRVRRAVASAKIKDKTPRISVLIELRRSADAIIPLLNHLYEHRYPNLEVVVVLKRAASKHSHAKLTAYRREHHIKLLKIIKHTKNISKESLIRSNISGHLFVVLSQKDRLNPGFFTHIASDFLNSEADIVMPHHFVSSDTALLSATQTMQSVWRHIFTSYSDVNVVKGIKNGYVYRRDTLLRRPSMTATMHCLVSHTTTVITASDITWKTFWRTQKWNIKNTLTALNEKIPLVVATGVFLFIATYAADYNVAALTALAFISCIALYVLFVMSITAFSMPAKITHALFAPFGICFLGAVYIASVAIACWHRTRKISSMIIQKIYPSNSIS